MFQIGGVVLLRCGCVAEERTAKGCGKFGDKFLTGIERIPEKLPNVRFSRWGLPVLCAISCRSVP